MRTRACGTVCAGLLCFGIAAGCGDSVKYNTNGKASFMMTARGTDANLPSVTFASQDVSGAILQKPPAETRLDVNASPSGCGWAFMRISLPSAAATQGAVTRLVETARLPGAYAFVILMASCPEGERAWISYGGLVGIDRVQDAGSDYNPGTKNLTLRLQRVDMRPCGATDLNCPLLPGTANAASGELTVDGTAAVDHVDNVE
jgi:hypothetical protein